MYCHLWQLRVVKRALKISVAWLNVGEAATLGTAVGPSEKAGHATRSTNVAEVRDGIRLRKTKAACRWRARMLQVRQRKSELANPVLVALALEDRDQTRLPCSYRAREELCNWRVHTDQ